MEKTGAAVPTLKFTSDISTFRQFIILVMLDDSTVEIYAAAALKIHEKSNMFLTETWR